MSTYDPSASELVGAKEVADELGYGQHGIIQAMRDGNLWSIKIDNRWFTTWLAVLRWSTMPQWKGRNKYRAALKERDNG